MLRNETDLDNNWLGLNLTLVEKNAAAPGLAQTESPTGAASDDGERWSEDNGSASRTGFPRSAGPGSYYFVIDPGIFAEKPVAVADRIRVIRDQAAWSNFFILLDLPRRLSAVQPLPHDGLRYSALEERGLPSSGADPASAAGEGDSGGDD